MFADTEAYFYISYVTYSLGVLLIPLSFYAEIKNSMNKWRSTSGPAPKLIWINTPLCIFFYWCTSFLALVTRINTTDDKPPVITCAILCEGAAMTYNVAKALMYSIMVLRMFVAYKESSFKLSQNFLYAMLVYIVIVIIGNCTHILAGSIIIREELNLENKTKYACTVEFNQYGIFWTAANDLILFIITIFMFIQRLCKLSIITEHDNARLKMYDLAVKYTLLGILTASVSFITLILVGLARFSFLTAVDGIVASTCLTLMSKSYDDYYRRACCCCLFMIFGKDFKSMNDILSNDPSRHLRRLGTATAAFSHSGRATLGVGTDLGLPRSPSSKGGARSESQTKSAMDDETTGTGTDRNSAKTSSRGKHASRDKNDIGDLESQVEMHSQNGGSAIR